MNCIFIGFRPLLSRHPIASFFLNSIKDPLSPHTGPWVRRRQRNTCLLPLFDGRLLRFVPHRIFIGGPCGGGFFVLRLGIRVFLHGGQALVRGEWISVLICQYPLRPRVIHNALRLKFVCVAPLKSGGQFAAARDLTRWVTHETFRRETRRLDQRTLWKARAGNTLPLLAHRPSWHASDLA